MFWHHLSSRTRDRRSINSRNVVVMEKTERWPWSGIEDGRINVKIFDDSDNIIDNHSGIFIFGVCE